MQNWNRRALPVAPREAPEGIQWKIASEEMPRESCWLIALCQGYREHSGARWQRNGYAFMVWHGTKWSPWTMREAMTRLDADHLQVTHWCYLSGPEDI